ncbi:AI-2E family transporter [Virgisporangium aliadipatigenens]|uniref:AI-2E family transporter n=1 Tax=Virgisporangium aliadipatigenens TaxID=741659 RepID=A0A8J3YQ17_9ACTN|nr:AI-2E family transporter [Virgisporangium aliadipatigenens]GIJ47910.1 AI-2E family transporter [Virgisporangium aliadipatigenens]
MERRHALPGGVVLLLGAACAVITVAGLHAAAPLAGPVLCALVITVAVSPFTAWLRRRGAKDWLAVAATVATVHTGLILLIGSLALSVARLANLLPRYEAEFAALPDALRRLGIPPETVARLAQDVLGGTLGVLSGVVLLLAVALFMAMDLAWFPHRLELLAARRPDPVGALRRFARGTRRYLVVCTAFGFVVAVVDTAVLWALDIPLPVLWGLLAFVTNYVPNVGFVVGLVPPALLGLLEGGPRLLVTVIVLYSVVNFVLQSVIQPKVVGDAVGLSATVSFLSLVFWGWVLGPLGALLAVPLTLLVKALLVDADPATRWAGPFLAGER